MKFRHPETGRFISKSEWESLQPGIVDEEEDWEDLEDWDSLGEDEVY
jgi:hypothetical protein